MYAQLDSPLPNLTLSMRGCHSCGSRGLHGLGDDSVDTTSTYDYGNLTDPSNDLAPLVYYTPENTISPLSPTDFTDLPLTPDAVSLMSDYPASIGSEFTLVGPDQYVNIQTGQIVPMSVAQAVTAATVPPANLSTTDAAITGGTLSIADVVDPSTGTSYNGTLTAAAAALQATGALVTSAGKLTAAGQQLAAQGQLLAQPPSVSAQVSSALTSLSTWFTGQTLMAGVPNWGVLAGAGVGLTILSSYLSSRPKRRKR